MICEGSEITQSDPWLTRFIEISHNEDLSLLMDLFFCHFFFFLPSFVHFLSIVIRILTSYSLYLFYYLSYTMSISLSFVSRS